MIEEGGALKTTFEDWAHASAFLFRTFEDQWRLLAFDAFETSETSADYHPIQPTRYVRNPGIPGFLDSWNSSDCTSRADLATSPLSCALTLKSTGLLAHARAQRLPLVQLCVNLLLGHGGRAVEIGGREPRHCRYSVTGVTSSKGLAHLM